MSEFQHLEHRSALLRSHALRMIYAAQSGHPGSSFSTVEILMILYRGGYLQFDAQNPESPERDYLILSKGHGAPALYAMLGELGYFDQAEFYSLRQVDSLLQGHPEKFIPGCENASGPLGQGLSIANGIALGLRMQSKDNKVYCILGDGELQEGNVWEAIMTANKYGLGNLVAIVDRNGLQIDGPTEEICPLGDVAEKFSAFGWWATECDGHNFEEISTALDKALAVTDQPAVIVAHTVKGKGVSFMENQVGWHGKAPNDEQFQQAQLELDAQVAATAV